MSDVSNRKRIAIPDDDNGRPVQLTPSAVALAITNSSSISSSSSLALNAKTTFLRCYAKSQDVYLKWGTTAVTSSNFDEVIPAGQVVDLFVPQGFTAARLIEAAATATIIIIEK